MGFKANETDEKTPRAFLTYSWDNEDHKKWVLDLATKLKQDGVQVKLDQLDLVPGDRLPQFMEQSLRDCDFTLVICTPGYKQRSEGRLGGVGFEGHIITAELMTGQDSRKFIPLLRSGTWLEASPSWLLGTYYLDFSTPDNFEPSYNKLLDTLRGGRLSTASSTKQRLDPVPTSKPRSRLPLPRSRLIGRDQDKATVRGMLLDKHIGIVTLTGPAGTGKSRLSLHVADSLKRRFPDGVVYVELSSLREPSLVVSTIAQALGLKEEGGKPVLESIVAYLADKKLLLVIDNFEHVASAAGTIGDLISQCPRLKILVTSRRPLNIPDEHEFIVPPLALPESKRISPKQLSEYSAIQLFIERAQAVDRTFRATAENLPDIAEICSRLDALPLAIELAAARIKVFGTPQGLLERLVDRAGRLRFSILTKGERNSQRQQALEAAINWSYDLLQEDEKTLFRQLSVFARGCTLQSAEGVCQLEGSQQIEIAVESLVNWNLLVRVKGAHGQTRFTMLETIRQLALARLAKNEVEKHETERRHAKYFVEEAVASEQDLGGTDLRDCMDRFKTEQDNMRAAFAWSLKKDPEMALRFAYALSAFWNMLGQLTEERKGLNAALEAGKEAPARLQIRVLGRAAVRQSDLEFAKSLARKHLTLSRLIENPWEEAWALHNLGKIAQAQAESDKARAHQNEALTLFQRLEDKRGMAMTLLNLCVVALDQRELGLARRFGTESLKLSEEVGNRGDLPIAQCYLAFVSHKEGKEAEAEALIRESVDMLRKDERKSWLPWGLHWQGRIATGRGDFETARTVLVDSLTLFQINEDSYGIIRSLLAFSWLNARQAHWDQAAILLAAEESLRTVPEAPDWKEEIKFIRDGSEGNLDPASYANAREKGAQLSWDQAVSFALGMS